MTPCAKGRPACAAHDPETREKAHAAAAIANRRRPGYLDREEADKTIVFTDRATIKSTLQALARHVVAGELEARAVNATILAANGALQVINDQERAAAKSFGSMTDEEIDEHARAILSERQTRIEAQA